ncbi:hypothetical protein WDZ92_28690 [Nostoc sp. NIES-2111]
MLSEHDRYWKDVGIGMGLAMAALFAISLAVLGAISLVRDVLGT